MSHCYLSISNYVSYKNNLRNKYNHVFIVCSEYVTDSKYLIVTKCEVYLILRGHNWLILAYRPKCTITLN